MNNPQDAFEVVEGTLITQGHKDAFDALMRMAYHHGSHTAFPGRGVNSKAMQADIDGVLEYFDRVLSPSHAEKVRRKTEEMILRGGEGPQDVPSGVPGLVETLLG